MAGTSTLVGAQLRRVFVTLVELYYRVYPGLWWIAMSLMCMVTNVCIITRLM